MPEQKNNELKMNLNKFSLTKYAVNIEEKDKLMFENMKISEVVVNNKNTVLMVQNLKSEITGLIEFKVGMKLTKNKWMKSK